MEPFAKRQRLYSPIRRDFAQSRPRQQAYDDESDELGRDVVEEEDEPPYEAGQELQERRARLDRRLKGTFEAIFAKYERDFDGIGDEIDLATGEIVVNNGHLIKMANERDAGIRGHRMPMRPDMSTPVEESGFVDDSEEEEEESNSEDDGDDTTPSDVEMDEDDLILRGFAQANRYVQASPELGLENESFIRHPKPRHNFGSRQSHPGNHALSAHSDIVAQFGPQLGAQIASYISQQESATANAHIEPAWRVPELPKPTMRNQPVPKRFRPLHEVARSPSPGASSSVWAVPRKGPKPQTIAGGVDRPVSSARSGDQTVKRNRYTDADLENMLDWIATSRKHGLLIISPMLWKGLAAKYPHHSATSWQAKCKVKFPYLFSNPGSDDSASEPVEEPPVQPSIRPNPRVVDSERPEDVLRPSRVRKPAQQDSMIISWSDAVEELATVDPDTRAGILHDPQRAKTGDWVGEDQVAFANRHFGSKTLPVQEAHSRQSTGQIQLTKPHYAQASAKASNGQMSMPRASGSSSIANGPPDAVPCSHPNCRQRVQKMYKCEPRVGEDLSQMTLHLLREHRIKPFPCGELGCLSTGEDGYLMQEELVDHVKAAHPNLAALQRLRSRVDPSLLSRDIVRLQRNLSNASNHKPDHYNADSDFTSARILGHGPASDDVFSSTPENDTTVTPSNLGRRAGAKSTSTPMTSISSLKVHHPASSTFVRQEIRDSQEIYDLPIVDSASHPAYSAPVPDFRLSGGNESTSDWNNERQVKELTANNSSTGKITIREVEVNTRPVALKNRRDTNHDAQNVGPHAFVGNSTYPAPLSSSSSQVLDIQASQDTIVRPISLSRSLESVPSNSTTIPNSQSPMLQRSFDSVPSTRRNFEETPEQHEETFSRNVVDPSHEFSDEDEVSRTIPQKFTTEEKSTKAPTPKILVPEEPAPKEQGSAAMLPPSAFSMPCARTPATPITKRKISKTLVGTVLSKEDLDELSTGSDELAIISSSSKLNQTPFGSNPGIKREGTVGPRMASVAPSKKRKLVELQNSDEIDELGADECFGKYTGPRIKKETDLNNTPMVHRIKAIRKMRMDKEAEMGVTALPSLVSPGRKRASTPLLDLTPDRVIPNSASSLPSSVNHRLQRAAGVSSPLVGQLTPTHNRRVNADGSVKGAAIVVKTPGGTFKRCGDGEFRCGRSFCFRCTGTSTTSAKTAVPTVGSMVG